MKKRFIKYLMALVPILWMTSFAQDAGQVISGIVDLVSNVATQGIEANHQANMAQAQALMQQKMVREMGPNTVALSAVQMFPGCPIPAPPNLQSGMCSNISDPTGMMVAQNVKQMTSQYEAFYNQYSSRTPTAGPLVGLNCIEHSIKKLAQDLQTKSNNIQNQIDQIKRTNNFLLKKL